MARNTTHTYRCERCGLELRGRQVDDGRIMPSNAPASGEPVRACLCARCAEGRVRQAEGLAVLMAHTRPDLHDHDGNCLAPEVCEVPEPPEETTARVSGRVNGTPR